MWACGVSVYFFDNYFYDNSRGLSYSGLFNFEEILTRGISNQTGPLWTVVYTATIFDLRYYTTKETLW